MGIVPFGTAGTKGTAFFVWQRYSMVSNWNATLSQFGTMGLKWLTTILLLFYSQFNVDCLEAGLVILIPMETILYTTENAHTEKHFGKRPYAWKQIRTTFSGPSVSTKYSKLQANVVLNPKSWYWTIFTQSLKYMGLKSLFFRNISGQITINSSTHEFNLSECRVQPAVWDHQH